MTKHWIKLVNRPQTVLTGDMIFYCLEKQLSKITGLPHNVGWEFIGDTVSALEDKGTKSQLNNFFAKQDLSYLNQHLENGYQAMRKLLKTASIIAGECASNCVEDTADQLHHYQKALGEFAPYLYTVFGAEETLTNRLHEAIDQLQLNQDNDQLFLTLTTLPDVSDYQKQEISLLNIATLSNSNERQTALEVHTYRFGYMGLTNSLKSQPYEDEYFAQQLSAITNPQTQLDSLTKKRQQDYSQYLKTTSETPKDVVEIAETLQRYMIFRDKRIDTFKRSQYIFKPVLLQVASTSNVRFDDLIWYTYDEVMNLLNKNQTTSVNDRKRSFTITLTNGAITYNSSLQYTKPDSKAEQVIGQVAQQGHAIGKVRVVHSTSEMESVSDGDILVTTMTTPNLVPAMRQAGAIVTDEGGILCHAAIVSRELGIPCVIGTKNATTVFKNNDTVEVDAMNGLVKLV